jgi:predicted DNA-binding antitoxin AbrB/MazE fold protein
MIATVEAIYENGVLKLHHPLPLKDNAQVLVTIQSTGGGEPDEREAWLRLSEARLTEVWDNPSDDVFNELLDR